MRVCCCINVTGLGFAKFHVFVLICDILRIKNTRVHSYTAVISYQQTYNTMEGVFIPDISDHLFPSTCDAFGVPVAVDITDISTRVGIPVASLVNNSITSNTTDHYNDATAIITTEPCVENTNTITSPMQTIATTMSTSVPVTGPIGVVATTAFPNKRPRRAAAVAANQRVQDVLKWERCKESSPMFKNAAQQINDEFDRVSRGERSYQKHPALVATPDSDVSNVSLSTGSCTNIPGVISVDSDDEATALNSDVDDQEDVNNDDDDTGSLCSFVVDDEYVSDTQERTACSVTGSGGSFSVGDEDSDSDYDSEQDDSDFDNTMICNDDSDGDQDEDVDDATVGMDSDDGVACDDTGCETPGATGTSSAACDDEIDIE